MLGAVKNAAMAAAGLVAAEKVGGAIASRVAIPGGEYGLPAAMLLGGAYLGGRGGLIGKLGYGMALSGILHFLGAVPATAGVVDVNFGGSY
jgi:hypothetical protein